MLNIISISEHSVQLSFLFAQIVLRGDNKFLTDLVKLLNKRIINHLKVNSLAKVDTLARPNCNLQVVIEQKEKMKRK